MSTADFFNIFLLVSALHGFAFSLILFSSKNGKEKSMLYLNLLILSISLNNIQSWVLENQLFQHKFALDYIQIPWHFLAMPFLYMFLTNYLNITSKTYNLLKVVFPLFLFAIIAQVSFVLYYSNIENNEYQDFVYEKYTSIEEIVSFSISISLFIYSYYLLYKKENLFEKILSYDNLKWINVFFKLSSIGYILWITALIIKVSLNFQGFMFSYYPLRIYTTILIYWLGYQGLRQVRILKERQHIREGISSKTHSSSLNGISINSKRKSTLAVSNTISVTEEQYKKYQDSFSEIDFLIRSEKKFLLPRYTLQNLASETDFSPSTLSLIINNIAGKTFIDYLNEMRVQQAKELLTNVNYGNYTIASIGLESGFNSKSTFFTVFKKHTGLTPFSYRKQSL
ncbi:helix-turn-helix domain-containing protein [Tenacibaculum xiamenense]|uniref:helix-turn-helix domain-containing protein n=1 Tax=Tenacibaculum xiamenense TaxID=1261553 RepID=UPI003895412E